MRRKAKIPMSNRVNDPQETERIIIRGLSQKTVTANTVSMICSFSGLDRSQYLSQAAPRVHFVDITSAIMDANKSQSDDRSSLEKAFREFADKWYKEISGQSSLSRITSNENYLKIIKLGEGVVPF